MTVAALKLFHLRPFDVRNALLAGSNLTHIDTTLLQLLLSVIQNASAATDSVDHARAGRGLRRRFGSARFQRIVFQRLLGVALEVLLLLDGRTLKLGDITRQLLARFFNGLLLAFDGIRHGALLVHGQRLIGHIAGRLGTITPLALRHEVVHVQKSCHLFSTVCRRGDTLNGTVDALVVTRAFRRIFGVSAGDAATLNASRYVVSRGGVAFQGIAVVVVNHSLLTRGDRVQVAIRVQAESSLTRLTEASGSRVALLARGTIGARRHGDIRARNNLTTWATLARRLNQAEVGA